MPTPSAAVVSVAVPFDSAAVPSVTAPFLNSAEPVGMPPVGAETVAVSVTDWPSVIESADELTVVVVGAGVTTCVRFSVVEARKLSLSGKKEALMPWLPTANADVENEATPLVVGPLLMIFFRRGVEEQHRAARSAARRRDGRCEVHRLAEDARRRRG